MPASGPGVIHPPNAAIFRRIDPKICKESLHGRVHGLVSQSQQIEIAWKANGKRHLILSPNFLIPSLMPSDVRHHGSLKVHIPFVNIGPGIVGSSQLSDLESELL